MGQNLLVSGQESPVEALFAITLVSSALIVVLSFVVDGVFGVCVIDVAVSCVGLANVLDLSMIVVLWCEREIV